MSEQSLLLLQEVRAPILLRINQVELILWGLSEKSLINSVQSRALNSCEIVECLRIGLLFQNLSEIVVAEEVALLTDFLKGLLNGLSLPIEE